MEYILAIVEKYGAQEKNTFELHLAERLLASGRQGKNPELLQSKNELGCVAIRGIPENLCEYSQREEDANDL